MNGCNECQRYDERHIGKQSAGWPFCLDPGEEHEQYGVLTSWVAWKAVLQLSTVRIFDEYGREEPKEEFFAAVEVSGRKPLPYESYTHDERRDPDGYRFATRSGFS